MLQTGLLDRFDDVELTDIQLDNEQFCLTADFLIDWGVTFKLPASELKLVMLVLAFFSRSANGAVPLLVSQQLNKQFSPFDELVDRLCSAMLDEVAYSYKQAIEHAHRGQVYIEADESYGVTVRRVYKDAVADVQSSHGLLSQTV